MQLEKWSMAPYHCERSQCHGLRQTKAVAILVVKMTLMPLLKEAWVQQAWLLASDKGRPFSVVSDGSSYYP